MMKFKDRQVAGVQLAEKLKSLGCGRKDCIVMGITRGGVVVAREIAKSLNLPLDIIVVKKIGAPFNPELATGAVTSNNVSYFNEDICKELHIRQAQCKDMMARKYKEVKEKEKLYRRNEPYQLEHKIVLLVDDGVATGATVIAAQKFLRAQKVKKIILTIPVIATTTLGEIKNYFDEIIALQIPNELSAVGEFYQDFPQVEDEEVISLLESNKNLFVRS